MSMDRSAGTAEAFSRAERLLGREAMDRLSAARVAVFGLGGVGGCAVEALARSGVGALDLIDSDRISASNLNRQILALHSSLGRLKTEVAAERVRDINPACRVRVYPCFFLPETAEMFDFSQYDYIVDAIDTVTGKLCLAEHARAAGVPLISALGAGNKLDPTAFRISDISETSVDPLARVMRKELKKRGIEHLKVVWSPEAPLRPAEESVCPEETGRRTPPGSTAFVPPTAGLILASVVVRDLVGR